VIRGVVDLASLRLERSEWPRSAQKRAGWELVAVTVKAECP